jgi:glyoxylase I family protein
MRRLDHVVLWTKNPQASMDFYTKIIGLDPVRFDEYAAGAAPFPSVRVSEDSIIDLMPMARADATDSQTQVGGSAGHPVNHVCLAMSKSEYDALDQRLQAVGVDTGARLSPTFGARGWGPQAFYFADPDGNVLEARYYD